MFVIFRCTGCNRFLYTVKENDTRKCPCGETVDLSKAIKIDFVDERKEAAEIVRELQRREFNNGGFKKYR